MADTVEEQLKAATASGDVDQLNHLFQAADPPSDKTVQILFNEAASKSQVSALDYLFARFPSVPLDEDTIRAAIYAGSIPLFSALLVKDPSIIKMQFDMRGTPLIVACMARKPLDFLRFLLEAGADPNQDPDATTFPLALVAAFYRDTSAVDLLLEHGAKLEGSESLSAAAHLGNEVMVRHLLQRGASPNTDASEKRPPRDPPLHVALRNGRAGVFKLFLDHGADTGVLDTKGKTLKEAALEMKQKGLDMSEILDLLEDS